GVNAYVLTVLAGDPDGYCDFQSVFFNSFLPNGQGSTQNPFSMFDDGNILLHGDTTAMDSRFSLIVAIPFNTPLTGYYTFKYQARDRSGILSPQLIDSIFVRNE